MSFFYKKRFFILINVAFFAHLLIADNGEKTATPQSKDTNIDSSENIKPTEGFDKKLNDLHNGMNMFVDEQNKINDTHEKKITALDLFATSTRTAIGCALEELKEQVSKNVTDLNKKIEERSTTKQIDDSTNTFYQNKIKPELNNIENKIKDNDTKLEALEKNLAALSAKQEQGYEEYDLLKKEYYLFKDDVIKYNPRLNNHTEFLSVKDYEKSSKEVYQGYENIQQREKHSTWSTRKSITDYFFNHHKKDIFYMLGLAFSIGMQNQILYDTVLNLITKPFANKNDNN